MTYETFLRALNISFIPDDWKIFFDRVVMEYKERVSELLDEDTISSILEEFQILLPYKDEILDAAQEIRKNEALSLFVCLIDEGKQYIHDDLELDYPKGDGIAYRFYFLIPLIHTIRNTVEVFRNRGIPEDIIHNTLLEYDNSVYIYSLHNGNHGFNLRFFRWMKLISENKIIRLGRLNFELKNGFHQPIRVFKNANGEMRIFSVGALVHKSGQILGSYNCEDVVGSFETTMTETKEAYSGHLICENGLIERKITELLKCEWKEVFRQGDNTIAVHIPRNGNLTKEACEESYHLARVFFEKYYPEYEYRLFSCVSWMMNKQLKQLLKPTSNIVAFLDSYCAFPVKSMGNAVLSFVFQFPDGTDLSKIDYKSLPKDTSLEQSIKERYMEGNRVLEYGGIFFK